MSSNYLQSTLTLPALINDDLVEYPKYLEQIYHWLKLGDP
jgi:hypothetical protein